MVRRARRGRPDRRHGGAPAAGDHRDDHQERGRRPGRGGRPVLGGQGGRRRLHRRRGAGPRRRTGDGPHLAAAEVPGRLGRGPADRGLQRRHVSGPATADAALAAAIRAEAGTIVASLHRLVGDFDVAEEAVQDAVVEALRHWRSAGIPDNPGAWLQVAARRNALDRLRRQQRYEKALARLRERIPAAELEDSPDERLPLLFGCCHPALAVEARIALTLRAVVGLTTAQIARAFLVSEATMAQRIVRAKRKIVDAHIPLTMPSEGERAERLDDVLTVAYLMFNEGFVATV